MADEMKLIALLAPVVGGLIVSVILLVRAHIRLVERIDEIERLRFNEMRRLQGKPGMPRPSRI